MKDQQNKAAHESSAQLACEAASAIRTVASLTREDDSLQLYSASLEGPLRRSNRTSLWSSLFFALSQAMSFFVISLIFWYGSILVSNLQISVTGFFVALMVNRENIPFLAFIDLCRDRAQPLGQFKPAMSSPLYRISRLLRVLVPQ
jgi:ABC-type multidrug transport system fused ATPase/permease subunit